MNDLTRLKHCMKVTIEEARIIADSLLKSNRKDFVKVSSFAITSGAPDGYCFIWLSEVSLRYCLEHVVPRLEREL